MILDEQVEMVSYLIFSILLLKLFVLEYVGKLYNPSLSKLKLGNYNDGVVDSVFLFILHVTITMLIFLIFDKHAAVIFGIIEGNFLIAFIFLRHIYIYKTALILEGSKFINMEKNIKFFIYKNILHVLLLIFCMYLFYCKHIQIPPKIY